jgi:hypothetical protein
LPAPVAGQSFGGFILPSPGNAFKLVCDMSENPPAGSGQWELTCLRLEMTATGASTTAIPTPTATSQPDGFAFYIRATDWYGNPYTGWCVELSPDNGMSWQEICDNDSSDLDPSDGVIKVYMPTVDAYLIESKAPADCTLIPGQVKIYNQGQTNLSFNC